MSYSSPVSINGANLDDTWQKIVRAIRDTKTGAIENLLVHVERPTYQVPKQLQKYESQIVTWSTELQSIKPEHLPFTHGQRIFEWSSGRKGAAKLDQIRDYVVPMLIRNPRTKRAIVMVRNPSLDSELTDEPIPALISIQFKLHANELHATAYYRAQEMYFFWLVNMFELISMQDAICKQLKARSPEKIAEPASITTIAFTGYINPVDLEKLDAAESTTLAIERFGISRMKEKDLQNLLESVLILGNVDKMKELRNILVHDKQTLDRIRDVDYQGFERWQNFLQNNYDRIRSEFHELPDILRKVLFDLISLDMQLEREEELAILKKKIKSADSAMQELVNILAQK
jgi:hypothetical protein